MTLSNSCQLNLDHGIAEEDSVTYQFYRTLEGKRKKLLSKIGDGRVIKRFDKTGTASGSDDIVCPHFLELKWAYGCPLHCSYCYLQGTLRFMPNKSGPNPRPYADVEGAIDRYLEEAKQPEILNTGELSDSLMWERTDRALSKKIIPKFRGSKSKILIVSKLDWVDSLLSLDEELRKRTIASFSINSEPVARRWESDAPPPSRRLEAARLLFDAGFEVRIRIDPIVPCPDGSWFKGYAKLIDAIFSNMMPDRITLGSLRGLQSTIVNSQDRSWTPFLEEKSKWGRRIPFERRFDVFKTLIDYMHDQDYHNVALCKEPVAMWEALDMDWKHCRCNCVW